MFLITYLKGFGFWRLEKVVWRKNTSALKTCAQICHLSFPLSFPGQGQWDWEAQSSYGKQSDSLEMLNIFDIKK